uniref:putative endogenous retrovirus group FC1 Env polyprotein n=1 Tax=Jaculus jaculus TaxID=51337 RepID=UPI001E1B03DE|nr:putative endogenous retrovirus group FC1 Env polyprotein [Jaculus jaculus]
MKTADTQHLLLLCSLLPIIPLTTATIFQWEFQVKEGPIKQDSTTLIGSGHCLLTGFQSVLTFKITPKTITATYSPYACFSYDNKGSCLDYESTYGGCRYWSSRMHKVYGKNGILRLQGKEFILVISDPWHGHWEKGVAGQLYNDGWFSYPIRNAYIYPDN